MIPKSQRDLTLYRGVDAEEGRFSEKFLLLGAGGSTARRYIMGPAVLADLNGDTREELVFTVPLENKLRALGSEGLLGRVRACCEARLPRLPDP